VIDVESRCISEQYAKNITENILNNNHAVVENFTRKIRGSKKSINS
jgi:hypothetical protein